MSKVKVIRPDPETGAVIEELVSPHCFRRKKDYKGIPAEARAEIIAGERPPLVWEGSCPVKAGDEVVLSAGCSIEIWRVTQTKNLFVVRPRDYLVKERGSRLLRRVPQIHETPEKDENGMPIAPTPEAIAKATEDGNYTSSASLAITDAGDAVPRDYQDYLAQEAAMANALAGATQSRKQAVLRMEAKRAEARRLGKPGRVKVLSTRIARHSAVDMSEGVG